MTQTGKSSAHSQRPSKSAQAFRTISEVSGALDLPQHVLRFWETRFPAVKPLKRGGGRRYYRPEDVALLEQIRGLLYDDGYTIKGVQKLLREGGVKPATPAAVDDPSELTVPTAPPSDMKDRDELQGILAELEDIRAELKGANA